MTPRRIPLGVATPELRVVLACPVCATVHTVTVSLHVDAEHKRRHAAAMSMHSETQP